MSQILNMHLSYQCGYNEELRNQGYIFKENPPDGMF